MPYVAINKDLSEAKTTVMFGLTKRQLIMGPPGIILGGTAFFLTKNTLGTTIAALLLFACVVPFFWAAEYKKMGNILKNWLKTGMKHILSEIRQDHIRQKICTDILTGWINMKRKQRKLLQMQKSSRKATIFFRAFLAQEVQRKMMMIKRKKKRKLKRMKSFIFHPTPNWTEEPSRSLLKR